MNKKLTIDEVIAMRKEIKANLMNDLFAMIIRCTTATELRVVLKEVPKFKEDGMLDDNDIEIIQRYVVNIATKKGLIK